MSDIKSAHEGDLQIAKRIRETLVDFDLSLPPRYAEVTLCPRDPNIRREDDLPLPIIRRPSAAAEVAARVGS